MTQKSDVHARLASAEKERKQDEETHTQQRKQDQETHTQQLLLRETSRNVLEQTHTEQVLRLKTSQKMLEDAHAEQLLHFETSRKSFETSMAAKLASVVALEESLGAHFCTATQSLQHTATHCNTLHDTT